MNNFVIKLIKSQNIGKNKDSNLTLFTSDSVIIVFIAMKKIDKYSIATT